MQFEAVQSRLVLLQRREELLHELSDDSLRLIPDFKSRLLLLQRLRYIGSDMTVLLKGRVACEVCFVRVCAGVWQP